MAGDGRGQRKRGARGRVRVGRRTLRSIVRWAILGGRGGRCRLGGGGALAKQAKFRLGAVEAFGEVEHLFILLGDVALEPGEALFESVNAFV